MHVRKLDVEPCMSPLFTFLIFHVVVYVHVLYMLYVM